MIYIINIYKKDTRTKSGRRIHGSYEFDRWDREAIEREVNELKKQLYKESDGFTIEIVE
jgi:hypothetical protein